MTFLLSVLRTNQKVTGALRPQAPLPQLCWPAVEARAENFPDRAVSGGGEGARGGRRGSVWPRGAGRIRMCFQQPQPPPPTPSLGPKPPTPSLGQRQTTRIRTLDLGDPSAAPHSPFLRPWKRRRGTESVSSAAQPEGGTRTQPQGRAAGGSRGEESCPGRAHSAARNRALNPGPRDGTQEALRGRVLTVKVAAAVGEPDAENQDPEENERDQDGRHNAPHVQLHCETQTRGGSPTAPAPPSRLQGRRPPPGQSPSPAVPAAPTTLTRLHAHRIGHHGHPDPVLGLAGVLSRVRG